MHGEVLVERCAVARVMELVVARRCDQPFERTEVEAYVGVQEHRVQRHEHHVRLHRAGREAAHEKRQEHHRAHDDDL